MSKINPFGKAQTEKSALDILQENFGIGVRQYDRGYDRWDEFEKKWVYVPNENLECVIEFAVNEGKGTGRQVIPASEFKEYVSVLQSIVDSDFAEEDSPDRTEYIPTHTVARQSFKMTSRVEGGPKMVSVRCTTGKGAKPIFASKQDFIQIVNILQDVASNLEGYEQQAWDNYQGK